MSDQTTRAREAFKYLDLNAQIRDFFTKSLFFVGANPKSGSTWLQVMLNAHPEISCGGEGHFFDHFAPLLQGALTRHNKLVNLKNVTIFKEMQPFPRFDDEHFRYLLTSSIALLIMRSAEARTARVIGEKTPNNLLHFSRLETLFPHAKFIHVVRDGRDCAVSAWFHNLRINPTELRKRHATFEHFVENFAQGWKTVVARGQAFCQARPNRCLTIRYEDLTAGPNDTMGAAFDFLGVAANDATVAQCVADGAFEKMSGGRPLGVEDPASFMRKGQPGDWRRHFTPECNRAFLAIAGDVMARLGFND